MSNVDTFAGPLAASLVQRAEIPHVDQHTDSLGRQQPARVESRARVELLPQPGPHGHPRDPRGLGDLGLRHTRAGRRQDRVTQPLLDVRTVLAEPDQGGAVLGIVSRRTVGRPERPERTTDQCQK